ncbi:MAG: ThuA domain-containing protein [Candidatus Hydrogenedentes bacterium]|nr:ThuA domain-containing protein [Candidatus Hydrogenedentota bacterium]
MQHLILISSLILLPALLVTGTAGADELRFLYLSKSVGFEHSPVKLRDGGPSISDEVLTALATKMGARLDCTKDAGTINADNLKNYALVMFYTQGDLTAAGGKDGAPGMSETGVAELTAWIEEGGAFIGFHSATDTFRSEAPEPSPYTKLIGAEFRTHGGQFTGTMKVIDPKHPAMAHFPNDWALHEEWYLFRNFNRDAIHVLVTMDPGDERTKQEAYNIPAYPVVWCRQLGKGRIYSTALGHRDDVWTNPTFQQTAVDAIAWALSSEKTEQAPNFAEVVSGDVEK